ncbi:hypothetical protein FPQ18DRAFT_306379 [Pyronema domesticum]|nr:hypothetical protein FPQ18DRAFT_306379 [Pyronema domesticum]
MHNAQASAGFPPDGSYSSALDQPDARHAYAEHGYPHPHHTARARQVDLDSTSRYPPQPCPLPPQRRFFNPASPGPKSLPWLSRHQPTAKPTLRLLLLLRPPRRHRTIPTVPDSGDEEDIITKVRARRRRNGCKLTAVPTHWVNGELVARVSHPAESVSPLSAETVDVPASVPASGLVPAVFTESATAPGLVSGPDVPAASVVTPNDLEPVLASGLLSDANWQLLAHLF